jgi:hypothetical protein
VCSSPCMQHEAVLVFCAQHAQRAGVWCHAVWALMLSTRRMPAVAPETPARMCG